MDRRALREKGVDVVTHLDAQGCPLVEPPIEAEAEIHAVSVIPMKSNV